MIIAACPSCDATLWYPYEAGEKPIGVWDRQVCKECGEPMYIQRLSVGETLSEPEFKKRYPTAKKVSA